MAMNRMVTRVRKFEISVPTHVALCMFIMQVLASQLPFLADRNAKLAVRPSFWLVNCMKIGGHIALLNGPDVHSRYCCLVILHLLKLAFKITIINYFIK